jgi:hypothetical protein
MVSEIARKLDLNNLGIHDCVIACSGASIRVAEVNVTLHICAGDVAAWTSSGASPAPFLELGLGASGVQTDELASKPTNS